MCIQYDHIIPTLVSVYSKSTCLLVGDEGGLYMEHEARVLTGIVEHILPKVGSHVLSLDLAHGKAVSNAIVSHRHPHLHTSTWSI